MNSADPPRMTDKSSKQRDVHHDSEPRHEQPRREHRDDEDTRIVFTSWDCALVPDDSRG
jgi:hypothetical protein